MKSVAPKFLCFRIQLCAVGAKPRDQAADLALCAPISAGESYHFEVFNERNVILLRLRGWVFDLAATGRKQLADLPLILCDHASISHCPSHEHTRLPAAV